MDQPENGRMDLVRFVATMRAGARAALVGLGLAVLSQTVGIALLIAAVLAIAFLGLGVGVVLVPVVLLGVRAFADLHRSASGRWLGVPIDRPYRAARRPAADAPGSARRRRGPLARTLHDLGDPATWRDLLWLLLNIPLGLLAGVLAFAMPAYGIEGASGVPFIVLATDAWYGYGPFWPLDNAAQALVSIPLGLVILVVGLVANTWVLRGYAMFARTLLGPTAAMRAAAALHQRVDHLVESRSEVVEAQAAELRRIERDLHDGAQASLVAMGMSIGLAEELIKHDPQSAARLLAEARAANGSALAQLRALVRGIHPPVLAERGLAGAIEALAMAVAIPVDLRIDLPGPPPAPIESAAYFAVAETLTNIAKHSRATGAWIRCRYAEQRLRVEIGDDGVGGADPARGSGLAGIERRLAAFDGTMTVASPPGGPTIVTMELPCALSSQRTSPCSGTD